MRNIDFNAITPLEYQLFNTCVEKVLFSCFDSLLDSLNHCLDVVLGFLSLLLNKFRVRVLLDTSGIIIIYYDYTKLNLMMIMIIPN